MIKIICIYLLSFVFSFFNFPPPLPAQTTLMTGTIASIPEYQQHSVQFIFLPDNTRDKIFVRWNSPPPVHLHIGDNWMFKIALKPAWQNWLRTQHINAIGNIQFDYKNQIMLKNKLFFPLQKVRETIYIQLTEILKNKPGLGFISALTIGMRDQITQTQWEDLRGTGTNHLMAIAGLHIGFLFGFIYFLSNKLWRCSEKLMLWIPAQDAAMIAGLISAIVYAALSGFALPAQRAVIMLSVFGVATLSRRKISLGFSYSLAAVCIVIIEPLSIYTPTFWLSFTAVGLLLYGNGARVGVPSLLWHATRAQWVMAVGLIPLNLLFFQQLSLIGFFANIIAIPFVGFIILPLCLAGIFWHVLWKIAEYWLMHFWKIMHLMATLPHSQYYQRITLCEVILSMGGILLLLAPRGFPGRWLGIIWLLPLFLWH